VSLFKITAIMPSPYALSTLENSVGLERIEHDGAAEDHGVGDTIPGIKETDGRQISALVLVSNRVAPN
jgi:hypothetical protein